MNNLMDIVIKGLVIISISAFVIGLCEGVKYICRRILRSVGVK